MSRISRLGGILAATAVTTALTMAPSVAQERVIHDHDGNGSTDIKRVRVTHAPLWVFVKTYGAPNNGIPHFLDVWIDTDAGNPGPEFVATVWPSEVKEAVWVFDTERFGHWGKRLCTFQTGGYSIPKQTAWISFRRYCLRDAQGHAPERIRVSVQASDELPPADWLPAKHKWSRWIHRD